MKKGCFGFARPTRYPARGKCQTEGCNRQRAFGHHLCNACQGNLTPPQFDLALEEKRRSSINRRTPKQ